MEKEKFVLRSRRLWAALTPLAVVAGQAFGVPLSDESMALIGQQLILVVGGLAGIWSFFRSDGASLKVIPPSVVDKINGVVPLLALVALAPSLLLTGCATWQTEPSQVAIARLGVQYATVKVIRGDPVRAARVLLVVDEALTVAGTDPTNLDAMEAQARAAIPWASISPEDRILVEFLLMQVRTELEARLREMPAPGVPLAAVTVLTWVRDQAAMSAQSGG